MKLTNTSGNQDKTITKALENDNVIRELVDIIQDLDDQIEEWKMACDCSSPDDLRKKLFNIV
jgi:predicted nucleotide-binding protein